MLRVAASNADAKSVFCGRADKYAKNEVKKNNDWRYCAAFLRNPRHFFAGAAQSSVPVQDGCHPGGRGSRGVGEEGRSSSRCLALLCECVGTSVWMDCTPLELCERLCLYLLPPPPPPPCSPSPLTPPPRRPFRTCFAPHNRNHLLPFTFASSLPHHSPKTNSSHLSPHPLTSSPPTPTPSTSFWPLPLSHSLSVSLVDSVMRAQVDDGALGDLPLDPASVRCRDGGGPR